MSTWETIGERKTINTVRKKTSNKKNKQEVFANAKDVPKELSSLNSAGIKNGFVSGSDYNSSLGVLIGVRGKPKVGKTDFAHSVLKFHEKYPNPDFMLRTRPFFYIDTQMGAKRVAWRYKKYLSKRYENDDPDGIYFLNPFDDNKLKIPEAQDFVDFIDSNLNFAIAQCKKYNGGMIVIDNITDYQRELNNIVRKELGLNPTDNMAPTLYQARNAKLRELILRIKKFSNGIVIADDKEKVIDARLTPTGIFEPDWYHKIQNWVDIVFLIEKNAPADPRIGTFVNAGFGLEADSESGEPKVPETIINPDFIKVIEAYKSRISSVNKNIKE